MSSVGTGTVTGTVTHFVGNQADNGYTRPNQGIWGSAWAVNAYTGESVSLTGLTRIIDTFDGQAAVDTVYTVFNSSGALIYDTSASGGIDAGGHPVATAQSFVSIEQFAGNDGNDVFDLTSGLNGSASYTTWAILYGGGGDDVLWGGAGNDSLRGDLYIYSNGTAIRTGNDRLHGGAGDDEVLGDGNAAEPSLVLGDDIVDGGTGNDTLYGDLVNYSGFIGTRGRNTFVFDGVGSGQDVIGDFLVANDKIKLASGYGYATGAIALAHAADDAGGNAVIDLGNGDKITLTGVHAAALTAANFVIADTTAPAVTGVTTTPSSGLQDLGDVVLFSVKFSEAVTVAGIPKLLLDNGAIAAYASGSGTDTLVFSYTVATGQSTADLAVTGSDLVGGNIRDAAGNNADLAGVIGNPTGVLPVDAVGPAATSPIPDQSVAEDTAWSFQFAANAFTDADGDPLTYTASLSDGSALPAWLAFDVATRRFSGTPPLNFTGVLDLKVTASDGNFSGSDTFTLTVTPVNDAPVLAGVPAGAGYLNGPTTLAPGLTISDVDSATLTSATVHVSAGAFTAHGDVLAVSAADLAGTNITANYNAATETLTLSGTDTLAHYAQALQHVTFDTTNLGIDRAQTIEWQVNDGAASDNLSAVETTVLSLPLPRANDFNGNGHSDILWQNRDGTPAVWSVDGTKFTSGTNVGFNPGPSWHVIGAGDFNGDGKSDFLWQNTNGTVAEWFMNGGTLISGASVAFNPGAAWHAIGSDDFNGDGKSDILWQNADGQAAVWLMDGRNILAGANVGFNPGADWHVISAADFNGDGKSDILWQNANGQAAVWLMNGTNLVSGANVGPNPGTSWHTVGTGDFNGDGKADILWQNTDGTPAIWLMNGTSLISGQNVGFNPGTSWHALNTGDYNGDGKSDILWQNNDGTPAVWLMNGTSLVSGANVGFNPGTDWHVIPQHHDLFG